MSLQTQGNMIGDWLKWEEDNLYSREAVTLLAGAGDLVSGTVLGKITASGKYVQFDDTAADGSEAAAAVLLLDTDASGSNDVEATAILREAIVSADGLTWPATSDTAETAAAVAQLEALGIQVREGA